MKPIMKVTTGGTTGASVAIAAYYHVASGLFDRVLAIGWEKNSESDTTAAIITCSDPVWDRFSYSGAIPSLATEATAYMEKYGATQEDAALVAVRDRNNALNNPYAHLQRPLTVEEVMNSPMLAYPIKLGDICPRTDGAAARGVRRRRRRAKAREKTGLGRGGLGAAHLHVVRRLDGLQQGAGVPAARVEGGLCPRGHNTPGRGDRRGGALPALYLGRAQMDRGPRFLRTRRGGPVRPGGKYRHGREDPHQPVGRRASAPTASARRRSCRVAEAAIQVMGKGDKRQVPEVKKPWPRGSGAASGPT